MNLVTNKQKKVIKEMAELWEKFENVTKFAKAVEKCIKKRPDDDVLKIVYDDENIIYSTGDGNKTLLQSLKIGLDICGCGIEREMCRVVKKIEGVE